MGECTLYCSFCAKSQHEVRKLIAGPMVFICDECVHFCADICRADPELQMVSGEAEYLSWDLQTVRPANPIEQLAETLIGALERRGFGIMPMSAPSTGA